jgi:hypothetical protein
LGAAKIIFVFAVGLPGAASLAIFKGASFEL